jgi:Pyruvate/2-oxoacid:ferredoxin oxidoreductase gamma subunit
VLVNDATFTAPIDPDATVYRIDATGVATEAGNTLAASMVITGAYAAVTNVVTLDALLAAMRQSVPSYRTQHIETNERALGAGWDLLPANSFPAWEAARV